MAKKFWPETKGGKMGLFAVATVVGTLAFEHGVWDGWFTGPNFANGMASRVDSVAVGKPFNNNDPQRPAGGLRIEQITNPNASGVQAGWYTAFQNMGEHDPTQPSARNKAAEACGTLVINGGKMSPAEINDWSTAQRNDSSKTGDQTLAEQEYAKAADACTTDINHLIGAAHSPQSQVVSIPVALG